MNSELCRAGAVALLRGEILRLFLRYHPGINPHKTLDFMTKSHYNESINRKGR